MSDYIIPGMPSVAEVAAIEREQGSAAALAFTHAAQERAEKRNQRLAEVTAFCEEIHKRGFRICATKEAWDDADWLPIGVRRVEELATSVIDAPKEGQ